MSKKSRDFITQHIIAELNELEPTYNVTYARLLARSLVANAVGGEIQAQREVIDRVEGKAKQDLNVKHDGEVTLKSAAVSVIDDLVEFATGARPHRSDEGSLPN